MVSAAHCDARTPKDNLLERAAIHAWCVCVCLFCVRGEIHGQFVGVCGFMGMFVQTWVCENRFMLKVGVWFYRCVVGMREIAVCVHLYAYTCTYRCVSECVSRDESRISVKCVSSGLSDSQGLKATSVKTRRGRISFICNKQLIVLRGWWSQLHRPSVFTFKGQKQLSLLWYFEPNKPSKLHVWRSSVGVVWTTTSWKHRENTKSNLKTLI